MAYATGHAKGEIGKNEIVNGTRTPRKPKPGEAVTKVTYTSGKPGVIGSEFVVEKVYPNPNQSRKELWRGIVRDKSQFSLGRLEKKEYGLGRLEKKEYGLGRLEKKTDDVGLSRMVGLVGKRKKQPKFKRKIGRIPF